VLLAVHRPESSLDLYVNSHYEVAHTTPHFCHTAANCVARLSQICTGATGTSIGAHFSLHMLRWLQDGCPPSSSSQRWKHDAMNRRTSALSFSFSRGSICGILRLLLPLTPDSGPGATPAATAPRSGWPSDALLHICRNR
jgi:hypothetical protein